MLNIKVYIPTLKKYGIIVARQRDIFGVLKCIVHVDKKYLMFSINELQLCC